jgi:hypothetical protein
MDITLIVSKKHPIRMPEERNQPIMDGFYFLLFWDPTNPSKGQASFKPSRIFKFYFSPPCPIIFQGGGLFKNGFEKGKRRTQF